MDAASSTAADLATATAPSPSATATSIAEDFSWLSIKDVFLMTVLYVWYMFLFIACFAIVVGGLWLACMLVVLTFQWLVKKGPDFYSNQKEKLEKYWESSRERLIARQNGVRATNQPDAGQVQMSAFEGEEENEVRAKFGRETV